MSDKFEWLDDSIYYSWITVERPIEPVEYVSHQLDKTERLGAKTYVYFIQAGGKVVYESDLAEMAKGLKGDLIAEFLRQCTDRGIRFVAGWLATIPACGREVREHPDWMTRRVDGEPNGVSVCYNSPYRDFLFAQVQEFLQRYAVDGIYFDQVPVGCYCDYCRSNYRETYQEDMPELALEQTYRAGMSLYPLPGDAGRLGVSRSIARKLDGFASTMRRSWTENIRRVIDATRPECAFIVNRIEHVYAEAEGDRVDGFLPEAGMQWSYRPHSAQNASLERHLTAIYGRKPLWEVVKYDKMGVRSGSIDYLRQLCAEAVANGHSLLIRDQDVLDYKRSAIVQTVESTTKDFTDISCRLRSHESHRYIDLLHSQTSHNFSCSLTNASLYGTAQLLRAAHLPFNVVTESTLANDPAAPLLIVPNSAALPDATIDAIRNRVESGRGVLFTARAGELNAAAERREEDVLAGLAGVERTAWLSNRKRYPVPRLEEIPIPSIHNSSYSFVRIGSGPHAIVDGLENEVTDFNFGYEETRLAGDKGSILAEVCSFDQSLVNAEYFNRRIPFPGDPVAPFLVVAQGPGKCVYLAAPVGDVEVRNNCEEIRELFLRAIQWCAGPPEIDASDLPPTISLTQRGNIASGRMCIMLHATELIDSRSPGFRNAKLVLSHSADDTRITWSKGTEAAIEESEGGAVLRVASIEPYAAVELSFDTGGKS